MWSVAPISRVQELESKGCEETNKIRKILPKRVWDEEGLEIIVATWGVEIGGSEIDLELRRAKSLVHY